MSLQIHLKNMKICEKYYILWQCITGFLFLILGLLAIQNMYNNIQEVKLFHKWRRKALLKNKENLYFLFLVAKRKLSGWLLFLSCCSQIPYKYNYAHDFSQLFIKNIVDNNWSLQNLPQNPQIARKNVCWEQLLLSFLQLHNHFIYMVIP